MYTYKFKTNMTCQHCIMTVTPFLNELDFVDHWQADLNPPNTVLTVVADEDRPGEIIDAVVRAGYSIEKVAERS
ncbi:heavy-metal-associated domain-containing protein [Fulvivirga sedimenti]|uniref:Heavy-metal-associated domain-containing protein n=1 Tax=Fulvivirga sedimenti TaxID=2879465 RepID=A0A9X1HM16_9BACT|nr:heavy-metal-associated domain-containing protein [Fulvivirga sedimenti]MCA6074709.1 heavy-metal-associated domain-containing protein [Fulvivirga sedimenti]MCA6075886.1 heavy-metal-associated domain-containing protein [Fulvivirga sedimenti]MCA6077014.1 heavy-metal-associated domain-containing protein [Fulvivirga sedimenti]